MKIKEIQVGIKVTKNYNSYQAGMTANFETGEDSEKVGAELMEKVSVIVNKKIGTELNKSNKKSFDRIKSFDKIKGKTNEIEVGAAWPDKKFKDRLSVKDSVTNEWSDVKMIDLEKIQEGYKQETSEGVFIFRKLSEKERANNKMLIYRIYKIKGELNE